MRTSGDRAVVDVGTVEGVTLICSPAVAGVGASAE